MIFDDLRVWRDPEPRSGPENMAIDEWLTSQLDEGPILRIYDWAGAWVSLGYFQSLKEGQEIFGNTVSFVRRWTGGGIVDHRNDSTFSLIIPRKGGRVGRQAASDSYGLIHKAVVQCLKGQGVECDLATAESETKVAACFQNPVKWDVMAGKKKLAGGAQRRGRWGILHQGSVMEKLDGLEEFLAEQPQLWVPNEIGDLDDKYGSAAWTERVP